MIIRVICGVLASAIVLGVIARPPSTMGQTIGALMPVALLVGVAIRGTGRSRLPSRRSGKVPPP